MLDRPDRFKRHTLLFILLKQVWQNKNNDGKNIAVQAKLQHENSFNLNQKRKTCNFQTKIDEFRIIFDPLPLSIYLQSFKYSSSFPSTYL